MKKRMKVLLSLLLAAVTIFSVTLSISANSENDPEPDEGYEVVKTTSPTTDPEPDDGYEEEREETTNENEPTDGTDNVKEQYVISYHTNGGENRPSDQLKTESIDLWLSEKEPSREGYIFCGWSTSSEAKSIDYYPGELYAKNESLNLYAVWKDLINDDILGVYHGSYTAQQGKTGLTFSVYKTIELISNDELLNEYANIATFCCVDDFGKPKQVFDKQTILNSLKRISYAYVALFYFYPTVGNPDVEKGLYICSVDYDIDTSTYKFKGAEWIQHDTYLFADLLNAKYSNKEITGDVYGQKTSFFMTTYAKVGEFSLTKENESKNLVITTDNTALFLVVGDSLRLGATVEGTDPKDIAFVVETPDIIDIRRNNDIKEGHAYVSVIGKKAGVGFVTINDTSTGESIRIIITVCDSHNNSYTINNVPKTKAADHELNFYNFWGMHIDDFTATEKDDGSVDVTFNVFNMASIYGIVVVYDKDGVDRQFELIDRVDKYSEDIYSGLIEEPIQLIADARHGDFLGYRQQAGGMSKLTPVSVNVPRGGYIKITNSSTEVPFLGFINAISALLHIKSFVGEIDKIGAQVEYDVLTDVLKSVALLTSTEAAKEFNEQLSFDLVKEAVFSAETLASYANKLSLWYSHIPTKLDDIVLKSLGKAGITWAQSAFEVLAGPAGAAMKGCFAYNTAFNIYYQYCHFTDTMNADCLTISVPDINSKALHYDGLHVYQQSFGFDNETVLKSYMVGFDDNMFKSVMNNKIASESYEHIEDFIKDYPVKVYDISLIKNKETVQLESEVKVYLPVPSDFNKYTYNPNTDLVIYRIEEDYSLTPMNAVYNEDLEMLEFTTTHFSYYMIIPIKSAELKTISLSVENDVINWHKESKINVGGVLENYDVVYSSSNPEIATVDSEGKVYAIGEGLVVISAVVVDSTGAEVMDAYGNKMEATVSVKCKMNFFQKILNWFINLFKVIFQYK